MSEFKKNSVGCSCCEEEPPTCHPSFQLSSSGVEKGSFSPCDECLEMNDIFLLSPVSPGCGRFCDGSGISDSPGVVHCNYASVTLLQPCIFSDVTWCFTYRKVGTDINLWLAFWISEFSAVVYERLGEPGPIDSLNITLAAADICYHQNTHCDWESSFHQLTAL